MSTRTITIKVIECKCERCGWTWTTKSNKLPKHCADKTCNSPYWQKPRRTPKPQ